MGDILAGERLRGFRSQPGLEGEVQESATGHEHPETPVSGWQGAILQRGQERLETVILVHRPVATVLPGIEGP